MANALIRTNGSVAQLVMRLALGGVMLPHGLQKVIGGETFGGQGWTKTLEFFTDKMQLPYPLAVAVILAESLGAVMLIFGFMTRIAALSIAAVMVGAIVKVHWDSGFYMNWYDAPGKSQGYEYHLLAIGLALALVIAGGGAASLDRKMAGREG